MLIIFYKIGSKHITPKNIAKKCHSHLCTKQLISLRYIICWRVQRYQLFSTHIESELLEITYFFRISNRQVMIDGLSLNGTTLPRLRFGKSQHKVSSPVPLFPCSPVPQFPCSSVPLFPLNGTEWPWMTLNDLEWPLNGWDIFKFYPFGNKNKNKTKNEFQSLEVKKYFIRTLIITDLYIIVVVFEDYILFSSQRTDIVPW